MGKFKVVECGLLVFLAALIPRIVLNLFFYASYGLYAVNHVEAWLFKAVMSGTHLNFLTHSGGDPTVWILTGLSPYVPPEYHIIAVEWVGVLLSCATAVSIYFLANALYGRKTGLAAGIIYAMMVEPLALSTAGFTHDMLSIPLVVISLTLMVYAIRGGLIYGLVCSAMYYIVWAVAKNVNDSINVAVFASAIYAGFHFYMWGFEKFGVEDRIFSFSGKTPKYITKLRKAYNGYLPRVCQSHFSTFLGLLADSVSDVRKHVGKLKYLTYVGVVVFLLFLFNARILSGILDETLSALPQGRMGSADVTPATAGTYWLRYNILLLVFPLIAYYSLKREDIIGITVACLGFLFSMQMDRGTRIVDVGVAIMAALTLTFESKKNKPNTIRWVMGTWFAAVVVYMFFFTSSKFILTASALIFGIALYFGVMSGKTRYCLVVIAVYGLLLNLYYLYDLEARKIVTEGEYHVLKWLSGNNRGGSVLAAWDKGYLIEAVSGLGAVSTPNDIQKEIHSMLWMPDRQASINLRNNGVRYVLLNTENFNIVRFDDEYIYRLGGGLIFHDEYVPRVELADRYTIYKLVYGKSSYFKLLKNETDKNTGFGLMLYEVLGGDAENKTAVGGIAYSSGLDDTYRVLLHMQEEVNGTFNVSYVYLGNLSLSGGQLSEVMYYIENKSGNECLFRLERANGYASRLRGRLDLVNKGKEGDLTLRIRLIDQGRNEVAGSYVKKVSLGRGENFSVDYSFDNVEPYNTYALDFDSSGGVLLDSRGVESSVDTALFLEAFC